MKEKSSKMKPEPFKSKKLELIYLPIKSLAKLPGNPRKDSDPEAIKKLAGLITAQGVLFVVYFCLAIWGFCAWRLK